MTRATVNITTLYSSAQCVLSVVGSVGVILLFAGIPQLIYSPTVSVANLMTFLLGAILITTMVAGNSFLNYKYRQFTRAAQQQQRDSNATEAAAAARGDMEDKPPSYEAILSSDGLPPDYFSVLNEKPPKYEDIASGLFSNGTFVPAVPSGADVMERPYSTEGVADPQVSQAKGVTPSTHIETSSSSSIAKSSISKKEEEAPSVTTEVATENATNVTISHDSSATQSTQERGAADLAVVVTEQAAAPPPSPPAVTVDLREEQSSSSLDLRESES